MDTDPRGYMLIINNVVFNNAKNNREGSDKDVTRLRRVFRKLGFVVEEKKDLTAAVSKYHLIFKNFRRISNSTAISGFTPSSLK